jgi:sucrose phosphorylase
VQVFLPGVPQVYYVGLLGGRNDVELLQRTGVGRDINRHRFTPDEVTRRAGLALHPASDRAAPPPADPPGVRWRLGAAADGRPRPPRHAVAAGDEIAELDVDVRARTLHLRLSEGGDLREVTDLLDLER